jgi:hypothetical protein
MNLGIFGNFGYFLLVEDFLDCWIWAFGYVD